MSQNRDLLVDNKVWLAYLYDLLFRSRPPLRPWCWHLLGVVYVASSTAFWGRIRPACLEDACLPWWYRLLAHLEDIGLTTTPSSTAACSEDADSTLSRGSQTAVELPISANVAKRRCGSRTQFYGGSIHYQYFDIYILFLFIFVL